MHPWKADAEGRDRQRFVRQRSDGGRIPAHHVQGRLCIKTDSRQTEKLHALAALVQQYPGDVPVCFYLTDRKKMLSLRGGQAMAVQPESYAALCGLVPPEQIGFLPAK